MIMAAGALLMVVGVFITVLSVGAPVVPGGSVAASLCYAMGAVAFAAMQAMQAYLGGSLTIRRLRRIMLIGDACLVISALLMLEQTFHVIYPLMATNIDGYNAYCHYVNNNWGVLLLIGCMLIMYSTLRIGTEIKKEV